VKSGIVFVGNNVFESLFAISSDEQSKGLMNIKPPVPIMSFVYDKPQINKFWMHNTPSPLDIVFCSNGNVIQIDRGIPFSTTIIGSDRLTDLVIEFPPGIINSNMLGNKCGILDPSPAELKKIIFQKYSGNF